MSNSLGRAYSIKSKKSIDNLFDQGTRMNVYPFTIWYTEFRDPQSPSFQFVVSAPKKRFKTAVKRNRIKRLCKESIRLNKLSFEQQLKQKDCQIQLFLVYIGDPDPSLNQIEKKTLQLFNKIIQQLDEKHA